MADIKTQIIENHLNSSKKYKFLVNHCLKNDDIFEGEKRIWTLPSISDINKFEILSIPESIEELTEENFKIICKQISDESIPNLETNVEKSRFLGEILLKNPIFQQLIKILSEPTSLKEIKSSLLSVTYLREKLESSFDDKKLDALIWSYLKAGSLAKTSSQKTIEPLLKVGVHNFFRILPKIFMCTNPICREMYFTPKEECEKCTKKIEELAVCRNCSEDFHVSQVSLDEIEHEGATKSEKQRLGKKYKTDGNNQQIIQI